jgi:hypothetical protein
MRAPQEPRKPNTTPQITATRFKRVPPPPPPPLFAVLGVATLPFVPVTEDEVVRGNCVEAVEDTAARDDVGLGIEVVAAGVAGGLLLVTASAVL